MQEDVRQRPRFSIAEAARLARQHYGIDGTADELPSERDQNFQIRSQSGEVFVLKIANAEADRGILDCQNQAMQRVADRIGDTICPTVCETTSGQPFAEVARPGDTSHDVRLVTWIPGSPFAKVQPHSPELLRSLGRMLGRVSAALDGFSHPAARRQLPWDLANAVEVVREKSTAISDPARRDLAAYFLTIYVDTASTKVDGFRESVIHNDANDYNVLVDDRHSAGQTVAGLIDFGDIVHSHTVNELAVCLAYAILDKPDPIAAGANVVAGYHERFPLTDDELSALFSLTCMRLCTSVAMSAYQQQLAPDNEYLSISERPVWRLLEILRHVPPSQAADAWRRASAGTSGGEAVGEPIRSVDEEAVGMALNSKEILAKRQRHLGKSLSVSYRDPLTIVRGRGQYLYDATGNEYLDCVNNVCHVGHCHPHVVAAATRQIATLNTNTRYLHETIVRYAERLTTKFPDPLSVCFFVNSGSEANDLALRLARAHTKGTEIVVVDGAYHGNLSSLVEISPYKFDGPGGQGAPPFVHKAVMPDGYRGPHKYVEPNLGEKYAESVAEKLRAISAGGNSHSPRPVAAFICESLLSCGGQIELPPGYLEEAYRHVRAAGGVCIADEVQVGFGRVGTHFWGFETQGVIPDIVTLGKPIGNGHPLGAVVTTPEIAQSFANGMEYFNTYGGNPVSCAVGLAVLETIEREGLQAHAAHVGGQLMLKLKALMAKHSVIGDVRGRGLFLGVELVQDRDTLEPAAELASHIVESAKDEGVLLSTDGPLHNVIKIKPPLTFSLADAERLATTIGEILLRVNQNK